MGSNPGAFACSVLTWDEFQLLAKQLCDKVAESDFEPDMVVGLARGGWPPSRCVCDFLGLSDLTSVKVEHYEGAAKKLDKPQVRYDAQPKAIEGKDVLLVDDIVDTGKTIETAIAHVEEQGANEIRTALLQTLPTSEYEPDFYGEALDESVWVLYPWNSGEDLEDLLVQLFEDRESNEYTLPELYQALENHYGLSQEEVESYPPGIEHLLDNLDTRGVIQYENGVVSKYV